MELESANSTLRTALTGLMEAEMQRGLEQFQQESNCKLEDIRRYRVCQNMSIELTLVLSNKPCHALNRQGQIKP